MKRVSAKLNSSSGASMIIALLFLLLCLTVGAIILSAASTSAGRLLTARTNQQNYLTVSSAANILRGELNGRVFIGVEKSIYNSRSGATSLTSPIFSNSSSNALPLLAGNKAAQVFQVKSSFNPSGLMPSAVPLQVSSDDFDNVNSSFIIQSDYSLKITLSTSSSPASYPLTLTIPASVNNSTVVDISRHTATEDVNGVPTEVPYTITTTTHTVIVTWGGGVIS